MIENRLSLNEAQEKAVLSNSKYIMVVAGAGSGKTRVLTERIINLITVKNVLSYNILAITFTNKAANVMKERLNQKGLNTSKMWISTFHSMCVRILRENAHFIKGYNTNFTIYDETDKNNVIKTILEKLNLKSDEFKRDLSHYLSVFKNQIISLEDFKNAYSYDYDIENIVKCITAYEEYLQENNAFDFDDLLIKTYYLLKYNDDVREYYQNKFTNILVDEFQDTNEIQFELIKLLAGEKNSVFIVGDEDQCIYSWRGANYENISNFIKGFHNVELIKLEENYRSTKKILDVANTIIEKNYNRTPKTLYTNNSEGVRVEFHKAYDENEEASNVIENIHNLVRLNGYNYSDIAILVRLNSLTRNLEEKLLNYGINYRIFGGTKFYDRLEIKNFLAYLKVLNNDFDDVSFNRIVNWPKRGIGEMSVQKLGELDKSKKLMQNLMSLDINSNLSSAVLSKFANLKYLFTKLLENKESLGIYDFCKFLCDELRLYEYLNKQEEDKNRMLNIEQLLLSIKEYEENNPGSTLSDYLQSVTLISDIDSYDSENNSVTIATVHASKGLEFKVVFVVGLEDRIFPLQREDEEDEEEEERRLMYVAVTRAMERLYLTSAKSRFLYGTRRYQQVSKFIKDIGLDISKPREFGFENSGNYTNTTYSNYKNNFNTFGSYSSTSGFSVKDNYKQQEVKSTSLDNFKAGDNVVHSKFGEGVIISVNNDVAKILFKSVGMKELMIKYSPITKL